MNLSLAETIVRWTGGLLAFAVLGILLYGVWRGTQRESGRTTGVAAGWLRSATFYFVSMALFFGVCYLGWIRLPWDVCPRARVWMLVLGSLLYFPGLGLVLAGRLTLGKQYFVSTGLGAQLFAGHQLITNGPYAIIRHPMYTGVFLTAIGSLLVYFTWTTLFLACFAPLTLLRAWREEKILAAEFGEQWQVYRERVPMFLPGLRRPRRGNHAD
jgi:protein-S-isoprenylcysteine O-methyltransferase Ste14